MTSNWMICLAQIDRFAEMGRQLRSSNSGPSERMELGGSWWLLGALVFVVAVVAGAFAFRQWWITTSTYRMHLLFRQLCEAHQLSGRDRRRLARLAQTHRLSNPSEIFVRPELFDEGSGLGNMHSREWSALMGLRDRLFARRIEAAA